MIENQIVTVDMSYWLIIGISTIYLCLLGLFAFWFEKRAKSGKNPLQNPFVYTLSLAVYCTAWTYYGSVGKAVSDGLSFLTIYLGPVISMPLWWLIVRKMIKISKALRITTIADFIATRFGKRVGLSALITVLAIVSVIPYISIQLKAISSSVAVMASVPDSMDSAWVITLLLAIFILIFTFRNVDSQQKHPGLVTAIALESMVKLTAFLFLGGFVTFFLFDGFDDILSLASEEHLLKFQSVEGPEWFVMLFLSMAAIVFLPRQFHMIVAENTDENHLKKAIWLFPAYLLLINFFVIPVALGGEILIGQESDPDLYVLTLPLQAKAPMVALFTFLGGFSAATSMIVVSTIALSLMASNNLVMPLIVRNYTSEKIDRFKNLLTRRASVIVILLLAFFYYKFVSGRFPLVSIGLISFVAVAQFVPTVLGVMYWRDLTRRGAEWALIAGFLIWTYTLVIPDIVEVGLLPREIIQYGPFGLEWLKPQQLFGLSFSDSIVHGTFWSLLANVSFMVLGTLLSNQTARERNLAEFYYESYLYASGYESNVIWKGQVVYHDLIKVLRNVLGTAKLEQELQTFKRNVGEPMLEGEEVRSEFVNYAEAVLTGVLGAPSARMLISSISREEEIEVADVVAILKENREISSLNERLSTKSLELEQQTKALELANNRLKNLDIEKDDFISTVTHEMRTPLTSIRAISEILYDNPDLEPEERESFLSNVIHETERMTRLINQVLDLEKLESGRSGLQKEEILINDLLETVAKTFDGLSREKKVIIKPNLDPQPVFLWLDTDRISQVFSNLMSNAIKFTPKGGLVELGFRRSENQILFWVKDSGKGIEKNSLDRIFDKFFQARDQTSKKPKGTGLGLSITKRIIQMHNGEIWVDSTVGNGTTFYFNLPIVKLKKGQVN